MPTSWLNFSPPTDQMTSLPFDPLGLRSGPAELIDAVRSLPALVARLDQVVEHTGSLEEIRGVVGDIGKAMDSLATVATQLEQVASTTEPIPDLKKSIESISRKTALLGAVRDNTAAIGQDTVALPQVSEHLAELVETTKLLPSIERRMVTIEAAMPVLVEVQQHLARLPDTIETLGGDINKLADLLGRMLTSIDHLDSSVATLQGSVEPLGRIANRIPGRNSKQ
jgi:DNA repair ATPase RecN